MKRKVMLLIWVFASFHLVFAQPEVRKPSVEIFINGKMYQHGDELTVQKGQSLELKAVQKGGRRDLVNYPDNYLHFTPGLQISGRGPNGLIYTDQTGKKEWSLQAENASFTSDGNLSVSKKPTEQNTATILVGTDDFTRTYLQVKLNTIWQFRAGEEQKTERNESEAIIYLNVAGVTDTWFVSDNIHASGTKNQVLREKLVSVQNCFDSIESSLVKMDYAKVQRDIRELQVRINSLNSQIQELTQKDPAFKNRIRLVGLPSDRSVGDLGFFDRIQKEWTSMGSFISQEVTTGYGQVTNNSQRIRSSVQKYIDWQINLPENWPNVIKTYIPLFEPEKVVAPTQLQELADNSARVITANEVESIQSFFSSREEDIPSEIQQIGIVKNKLQAVKLFDGMLRSFISSINWAEWENTREVGYAAK